MSFLFKFDEVLVSVENPRKRKAAQVKPDSDANILWRINWPRVERFLRDDLIVALISQNELFNAQTIQIARAILKVGELKADLVALQSNPIAVRLSS